MKALAYLMAPSMGLPTIFSSHLTELAAAAVTVSWQTPDECTSSAAHPAPDTNECTEHELKAGNPAPAPFTSSDSNNGSQDQQ